MEYDEAAKTEPRSSLRIYGFHDEQTHKKIKGKVQWHLSKQKRRNRNKLFIRGQSSFKRTTEMVHLIKYLPVNMRT